ncbi:hypothetical protein ILUMI_17130, partial [Ignelater luminosus]
MQEDAIQTQENAIQTQESAIQTQPTDVKEDPISSTSRIIEVLNQNEAEAITSPPFVSNANTESVSTTVQPTQSVVKKDSNTTITYPTDYDETSLDVNDPKIHAKAIRDALTASPVNTIAITKALKGKSRAKRLKAAEEYKLLFKT